MNQLFSHRDGMVAGIAMEKNNMICSTCSQKPKPIAIDDTTMGDDDDRAFSDKW